MRRKMVIAAAIIAIFAVIFTLNIYATSEATGKSYFYDYSDRPLPCPAPYRAKQVIGGDLGLNSPTDMMFFENNLYILDSGNKRVVVLDNNYKFFKEITFSFDDGYVLNEPKGLWIDESGNIFIADRSGQAVIKADMTGKIQHIYYRPSTGLETNSSNYLPVKVVTDHLGVIYVLVENEYRGLISLNQNGEFLGYFGANTVEVTASLIVDTFWRTYVLNKEQTESTKRYLPSEYSNICVSDGFIYACISGSSSGNQTIRKLNFAGENVLAKTSDFGDRNTTTETTFSSITVDDKGFISAVDSTWNRIFQYDSDGNLLYIFGGKGDQDGTFDAPVSIRSAGNQLLILDGKRCTVTVMETTEFGDAVRSCQENSLEGRYDNALKPAQEITKSCAGYEMAYKVLGKVEYSNGNYNSAMKYFKKAYSQSEYSQVFRSARIKYMNKYFAAFMSIIIFIFLLAFIINLLKRKKIISSKKLVLDESGRLKYVAFILLHPVEGYEELRYNLKYSLLTANICYLLYFFSNVLLFLYTGFNFKITKIDDFNIWLNLTTTVGVLVLFVISNFFSSTFLTGASKLKPLWICIGYAQIPVILSNILYLLLSNVLTADEGMFLQYMVVIATSYTYILMFFAVKGLQMFSFKRAVASMILTIFGMLVVVFLIFLIFNLSVQMISFIETVIREAVFRINAGF